jgi:hypothetical protein
MIYSNEIKLFDINFFLRLKKLKKYIVSVFEKNQRKILRYFSIEFLDIDQMDLPKAFKLGLSKHAA